MDADKRQALIAERLLQIRDALPLWAEGDRELLREAATALSAVQRQQPHDAQVLRMIERDHPALVGKYRYDAKVFYQSNATYDPSGIAQTPPQATHTVARLRALALKATPGPWDFEQNALLQDNGWAGALLGRVREPRDVAYISAADPQTVLALLDELARLRESALRSSTDASVPEGGGSLDEPKCSPTLTLCPRCKNDIAKCDGLFATREDEHD